MSNVAERINEAYAIGFNVQKERANAAKEIAALQADEDMWLSKAAAVSDGELVRYYRDKAKTCRECKERIEKGTP